MSRRIVPHTAASLAAACNEYRTLDQRGTSRRTFLKGVAGSGALLLTNSLFPSLPFVAFAQTPREVDTLVVVFLRGGMDGLSAVVPVGEGAAYYDRRRATAIPEASVLDLDGFFGFHPSLAPLHEIYQGGRLAVVHAAGSPDPSRSHFDAMEYMERGTPGVRVTETGWLTRHLQTVPWANESPFRAVAMAHMLPTSLQGPEQALTLDSLDGFDLSMPDHLRPDLERALRDLYRDAGQGSDLHVQSDSLFATMRDLRTLAADDGQSRPDAGYPDTSFGQALRQVAQLIRADVGLEVACIDLGGWDTHEEQGGVEGQFAELLSELASGLAAFHHDLEDRADRLTVVTMSEFGRMLDENASGGTDHGRGGSMWVMGGGVNGGVHAAWPSLAADALDDGDLAITTDFRDVLSEILVQRLKSPGVENIFPGYRANYRGIIRPGA
jgi:uncharacterized protein (DUF1501 family)